MKAISVVAAVALAVAGCGSSSQGGNSPASSVSQATQPASTGNPCAKAESAKVLCSDKEVTETNCDGSQGGPKPFVAKKQEVQLGTVAGVLKIRKANPAQCKLTFWGLFEPNGASKGNFKVSTQTDVAVADQVSEPGNDKASAWTEGLYAPEGTNVKVCVVAGDQQTCMDTPSV